MTILPPELAWLARPGVKTTLGMVNWEESPAPRKLLTITDGANWLPPFSDTAIRMTFGLKFEAPSGATSLVFQETNTLTLLAAVCVPARPSVWVSPVSVKEPWLESTATFGLNALSVPCHW